MSRRGAMRDREKYVPAITGACMEMASPLQSVQQAWILVEKGRGRFRPQDDSGGDRCYRAIGSDGISIEFGHAGKVRSAGAAC